MLLITGQDYDTAILPAIIINIIWTTSYYLYDRLWLKIKWGTYEMREHQGHDKLYKMGFDGAAIEQLRNLDARQYRELLTILSELHADKYTEVSAEVVQRTTAEAADGS